MCVDWGKWKEELYDKKKTFLPTYRWNEEINDLTYFGNSSCLRSPPYKYTYNHLLRRHKLHHFRKDQDHNSWHLKNIQIKFEHLKFAAFIWVLNVEWYEFFRPHNLYLYKMWTRRKMTNHTLWTVLALVARHTGTSIVTQFNSTSCTVLARLRITIVDIWETYKSNSNISSLPPQSECIDD